jgi:hypothetical protein
MATTSGQEDDGRTTTSESDADDTFHDTNPIDTGFTPTLSGAEWREMQILLEITHKNNSDMDKSPSKHLSILHKVHKSFPKNELIIYDNQAQKVNRQSCKNWTDMEAYKACFTIHDGYGRHIVIF